MRKAVKFTYRIREDKSMSGSTYRPEYLDNGVWKPTHTFSFTGRPYFTSDYDKALECIDNHKNPESEVFHYDLEKKEKDTKEEIEEVEQENSYAKSKFWEVIGILFLAFALWGTGFLLGSALTCTCN